MDQNKTQNQNQNQDQNQGQNKQPDMRERGNASTTERIQPNQGGGGQQKPEGDDKQRNQQTKL